MICDITIKVAGKDVLWNCVTCGTQGEPTDFTNAYYGAVAHEKKVKEND